MKGAKIIELKKGNGLNDMDTLYSSAELLIPMLDKHLLSTFYVPGTVLGAGGTNQM